MGLIVEQIDNIETVEDLIKALKTYPKDMPVLDGFGNRLYTYRIEAEEDEEGWGNVTVEGK